MKDRWWHVTSWIYTYNFRNSRFHFHEFTISKFQLQKITIATCWIYDFNLSYMNSRFQLHDFVISTSWNKIRDFPCVWSLEHIGKTGKMKRFYSRITAKCMFVSRRTLAVYLACWIFNKLIIEIMMQLYCEKSVSFSPGAPLSSVILSFDVKRMMVAFCYWSKIIIHGVNDLLSVIFL